MLRGQRDERRLRRGQQVSVLGAFHGITERDAAGREIAHPAADAQQLVIASRLAVTHAQVGDREEDPLLLHLAVGEPGGAEVLGAGHVEPHDIAGVIDHAHLVRLRVVDAMFDRADLRGAGRSRGAAAHSPYGIQMFFTSVARRRNARPSPWRVSNQSRGRSVAHVRFMLPAEASSTARTPAAPPKYHNPSTSRCSASTRASASFSPVTMFTTPPGRSEVSSTP